MHVKRVGMKELVLGNITNTLVNKGVEIVETRTG